MDKIHTNRVSTRAEVRKPRVCCPFFLFLFPECVCSKAANFSRGSATLSSLIKGIVRFRRQRHDGASEDMPLPSAGVVGRTTLVGRQDGRTVVAGGRGGAGRAGEREDVRCRQAGRAARFARRPGNVAAALAAR